MAAVTQALRDLLGDGAADTATVAAAELHARWAHRIELHETWAHYDAEGRLRLAGVLRFEAEASLRLQATDQGLLRVGARVLDARGAPIPGLEARAGLPPQAEIDPGQALPFSLTLPRFDANAGDAAIEVGLVYEGRFWFSEAGFAATRLAFASTSATPPSDAPSPAAAPPPPRVAPRAASETVDLLYRALLDRPADPTGLTHYTALLESGVIDEKGLADILIGSGEFRDRSDGATFLAAWATLTFRDCRLLAPPEERLLDRAGEPAALGPFLEACRLGGAVLDVGAGIGAFSLPAAVRVGDKGMVYAVEADPRRAGLLAQSIALGGFSQVVLLPLAAADSLGHVRLQRRAQPGSAALGGRAHPADFHSHDLAAAVSIDTLRPALRRIDVLRLDAGALTEPAVRGARELLRQDKPRVFVACIPPRAKRGRSAAALFALLGDLDYAVEIIGPAGLMEPGGDDPVAALDNLWRCWSEGDPPYLSLRPRSESEP